jgi:hypothetical protein
MRSTNIVIFLVLLNAAAGVVGAVGVGPAQPATGASGEIDSASTDLQNRQSDQPATDEITGSFFGVGKVIQTIDGIIFHGPNMLGQLGMPGVLVGALKTVITFVVAFDVAEAVTGRVLS